MNKEQRTKNNEQLTRAVVLLSGGMDSATLLHYVKNELKVPEIYTLSIQYGQKHSRELEMAGFQAREAEVIEHRIIEIPAFRDLVRGGSALTDPDIDVPDLHAVPEASRTQPPTYVPNRNMVLLSVATAYAEARGVTDVFYGAQAQDEYGYWDCTADFVERLNAVLTLNRRDPVRIHAPFVRKRKQDVLKIGLELGVDYAHTWSCYRGGETPCGTCPSCVEREKAFKAIEKGEA